MRKEEPASRSLTDQELSKLTGRAGLDFGNSYKGNIYNGNRNVTISELTISITTTTNGKEVTRQYVADIEYGRTIPPLKTGDIRVYIIVGDKDAHYSWGIVGAKGY
jgi:hypothetical protein